MQCRAICAYGTFALLLHMRLPNAYPADFAIDCCPPPLLQFLGSFLPNLLTALLGSSLNCESYLLWSHTLTTRELHALQLPGQVPPPWALTVVIHSTRLASASSTHVPALYPSSLGCVWLSLRGYLTGARDRPWTPRSPHLPVSFFSTSCWPQPPVGSRALSAGTLPF